jgi:hypothetical protein
MPARKTKTTKKKVVKKPHVKMNGELLNKPRPSRRVDTTNRKDIPNPKSRGPRKVPAINIEEFEKLAKIQCTLREMAWWFGCSEMTIVRRIKEEPWKTAWERGKADGCISIRRAQMAAVQDPQCKGHSTMLVWLGKIFLGQRETQEINLNQQENAARGPYQEPFVTEEETFGRIRPGTWKKKADKQDGDPVH